MRIAWVSRGPYEKYLIEKLQPFHDIKNFKRYTDIKTPQKFDVVFVEYAGEDAIQASNGNLKHLIVRTRGVEIFEGGLRRMNWPGVKWFLTLGEYQVKYFKKRWIGCEPHNIGVLPHAVLENQFTLREREENKRIAVIANITGRKGTDQIPEFLKKYKDYKIFQCGDVCKYGYSVKEFLDWRLGKDNTAERYVYKKHIEFNQMSQWLEDKTYIWLPTIGESFGRAVLEGMCKGLKPIVRRFPGAAQLWPPEYIYDTLEDIKRILDKPYNREEYRNWVLDKYGADKIVNKFNEYIRVQ